MIDPAAALAPVERENAMAQRVVARLASVVLALGLLLVLAPAVVSADPGDIGIAGPSFQGASGSPSGSKPESKLWYHDGYWWSSMWDTATSRFAIWRLSPGSASWVRTAADVDTRANSRSDILWDGTKLYIASYQFSDSGNGAGDSRILRYSYNTTTDTYSLDSGFPASINHPFQAEAITIAKDSTGQLWATGERNNQIWVNRSTTADNVWGTSFAIPGATSVNSDDISSIIAFGGDRIGVMWSNQSANPDADYFAVHLDSAADTTWQPIETAYSGTDVADDHINLKTDSAGRVFGVVKTSISTNNPAIVLLVRQTNGTWSNHAVATGSAPTRPIVQIDDANSLLRVFYTQGSSGGTIVQKTSSMSSISFPTGNGTVVAQDFDNNDLNNVTSTKQNATSETGLVILATNDTSRLYWFADILGSTPPPAGDTTPPVRTGATVNGASLVLTYNETLDGGSTPAPGAFGVTVAGSARSVSSVAVSGTTVNLTLSSPVQNGQAVTASYTAGANPIQDVAGNDAVNFSGVSVTNTTPPTGGPGGTFTFGPTDDAQVKSNSATANYGNDTGLRLREDAAGGTTYRSYVKFNVTGISGSVTAVRLRLWVADNSNNTAFVHSTATTWTEGALTWNNAPAFGATSLGSAVPATTGAWVEITLAPSSISGNGTYAFGIRSNGTTSAIFNSSEAATNRPELVVVTSGGPPPAGDTTPPVRTGATVNGASLVLTYNETLDGGSTPAPGAFGVTVAGSARSVSSVAVSGTTVNLTLSSPVQNGQAVTASYTAGANPIQDVAGNDAVNFSGVSVTNTTPPPAGDTTPPVRTGATVNGASLVLTYNETLDAASVPNNNAFTVGATSGARTVTSVAMSGTNVILTLSSPVLSTDQVTASYTAGANPIQDVAGNDAVNFSGVSVTNTTPPPAGDTTPPVRTGATVNGASLVLTYNETLDGGSTPAPGAFGVTVAGSARSVSSVAVSGTTVNLTLSSPVQNGQAVTASYTAGANPIQDVAGNDAVNFSGVSVTNTTPPTGGPGGTFTFGPTDDAQVKSNSATANYGNDTGLRLREDAAGGTTYRSYVKFNVTGISGSVTAVRLRLWVADNSNNTAFVHSTATTWTEGALTWNNAPAFGATSLGSAVPATTGAWVEITLAPSSISGNGTYAFGIRSNGTTSAIFNSSEAATNRPELVVVTSGGPPPAGDTTPPVRTGATVNGASLVLTYNETLDGGSTPAPGAFGVTVAGSARSVSSVAVSGTTVNLTLSSPVQNGQAVTASYTAGANPIQDVAGNDAVNFSGVSVTNTTPPPAGDTTPPVRTGATVNGASLVLTYNETLDGGSTPAPGAFGVTVAGSARSVSSVAVSGTTVNLTLSSPVQNGQAVTASYTAGANPIQDVAGNDAVNFSGVSVTNTTPPTGGPGGTFTFGPTDDAQVKSNSATANYGNDTGLRLREDAAGGTTYRSYVKFNVTGISGSVTAVRLRLWVADNSNNTAFVHSTATTWTEGALTWNNAPAFGATSLGSAVPATTGAWVEITLAPSSISGNGTYAFGIRSNGTTSAIFNSSEAATNRPELVVTTSP